MNVSLASDFRTVLGFTTESWIDASSGSIPAAASEIAKSNPKCLAIACQGMFEGNAEDSPGLDLVLWLRLTHNYEGPILLVGFLPEEEVRKGPKNSPARFLINAPGNRYVQLPVPLERLPELKKWLETYLIPKADINKEYKPYLQAGFSVENFRHSLANKFGLKSAWDLQNLIREKDDPYPEKLKVADETDKNLLIAGALYPLPKNDLSKVMSDRTGELRARIQQVVADADALKGRMNKGQASIEDLSEQASQLLANAQLLRSEIGNPEHTASDRARIAEQAAMSEDAAEGLQEKTVLANEAMELDSMVLPSLEAELAMLLEEIEAIVAELREDVLGNFRAPQLPANLKVLHVDDELDLGWSDLLKRMIDPVNVNPRGYRPIQPTSKNVNQIKEEVLEAIAHKDGEPDVILLDLRLMGEDERTPRPDSPPSGIEVLKAIRKKYRAIPIVITTASNKVWSHRAVMKEGADGYWTKQGVEMGWGAIDSLENHDRLSLMMVASKSALVRELRRIDELIAWMSKPGNQWWRSGCWANGRVRKGHTAGALKFLEAVASELKAYARDHAFGAATQTGLGSAWQLSGICGRFGGAAERLLLGATIRLRNGDLGPAPTTNQHYLKVRDIRNKASHGTSPWTINERDLVQQSIEFNAWLRSMGRNGSGTL